MDRIAALFRLERGELFVREAHYLHWPPYWPPRANSAAQSTECKGRDMSGIRKFARSLCKRLRDNGGAGATPPRKCALTFRIDSGYFEDSRIPFHGPCKAPLQETRGFRIFRRFRQSLMLSACAALWSTLAGSWHGDFVRASNLDRSGSTCPSPALELPSAFAASVLARMQKADRTRRLPSPVRASITGPIPAKARRLVRMRRSCRRSQ